MEEAGHWYEAIPLLITVILTVNRMRSLRGQIDRWDLSHKVVPSEFLPYHKNRYGPLFFLREPSKSFYYYFDGYAGEHWPTHDPLGKNKPNQKKNVVDPHGNIFIRAE